MEESVDEVLDTVLYHAAEYDPAARRLRYLRERELKGRQLKAQVRAANSAGPLGQHGGKEDKQKQKQKQKRELSPKEIAAVKARVSRIRGRLSKLHDRLRELEANARKSKAEANEKPSAADKSKSARESKKYREQNKTKIEQKRRQKAAETKSKSISNMNEEEVRTAIKNTLVTLKKAMAAVKAATSRTA